MPAYTRMARLPRIPREGAAEPGGVYLSIAEAAKLACRTTKTIRRWIDAGRIRRFGAATGKYLVRRDELEAFLASEPRRGSSR